MTLATVYHRLDELYRLSCIRGLLDWDQQVCLPRLAASGRADQLELMSTLIHARLTDPNFGNTIDELAARSDLHPDDRVNILEARRVIERQRRLPESFVAEQARVTSEAYTEWTEARPANDFARVLPHLTRIVELARREAELVGYSEQPYDALLDAYEPRATLRTVKPLLLALGEELSRLIPAIIARADTPPSTTGVYPEVPQRALCERVLRDIGYRFDAGRLDKTHHPFQSSLGAHDIRVTTRFDETSYLSALATTLHEAGHALYEDGLPKEQRGRALGSAASLGVHESQSRFWENCIGRSLPFARYLHAILSSFFPEEAARCSPETIWRDSNRVARTLIRVEADEVTYSLHVIVRLLLEEALITGELEVVDLPQAWGDLYERYLGIRPPNDTDGVLQDVHWYGGMIGYFPTYVLGNLYAAPMLEAVRRAVPDLDERVGAGDFGPILGWLRTHVHAHGMRYSGPELVERISGSTLSVAPFLAYIRSKFGLSSSALPQQASR